MAKNILRRCSTCGKFHASYRVEDPATGRVLYLCTTCWMARYGKPPSKNPEGEESPSGKKI